MLQTNAVEEIKTHILCSVTFFPENHAVYKIMKKNMGEMRFTCWTPKATDTHSECVSTSTMVAKMHFIVMF